MVLLEISKYPVSLLFLYEKYTLFLQNTHGGTLPLRRVCPVDALYFMDIQSLSCRSACKTRHHSDKCPPLGSSSLGFCTYTS